MLGRLLLYLFLGYIAYRFVFHFLLPVIRTSRQVRSQFHEMQNKMREAEEKHKAAHGNSTVKPEEKVGDYIDFEEIK